VTESHHSSGGASPITRFGLALPKDKRIIASKSSSEILMAQGKDAQKPLPKPNVVVAKSGTPPHELTAEAVKGILVNPIYAGVGPFPPIVTDQDWIQACVRMIKEDGA